MRMLPGCKGTGLTDGPEHGAVPVNKVLCFTHSRFQNGSPNYTENRFMRQFFSGSRTPYKPRKNGVEIPHSFSMPADGPPSTIIPTEVQTLTSALEKVTTALTTTTSGRVRRAKYVKLLCYCCFKSLTLLVEDRRAAPRPRS
jgi:hypothetical protein